MRNTFLRMGQMNKQKLLGQFYSGDKIAKVLFDLLGRPTNNTVIDPMCGEGDLLKPFCQSNHIFGVELDKEAYDAAVKNLSQNSSICGLRTIRFEITQPRGLKTHVLSIKFTQVSPFFSGER